MTNTTPATEPKTAPSPSTEPIIALEHASRWYGPVIGVNDVTCQVGRGLTALLGPNGAGKSTLMKLVTGQIRPTAGRLTVGGEKPFANPHVFRRLGFCPEGESGYDAMTGREFVTLLAAMAGLRGVDLKRRVDDAIEVVGMSDRADRAVGGYSKGMRQRMKVAQAIVHDPDILILDEPLNGLDPESRHELSRLFQRFAAEGRCVLVSSHILFEVEQMTSNILLLHHGRLLAQGDIHEIRSLMDAHPHRITFHADRARDLARRLLEWPWVLSARLDDTDPTALEVETRQPETFYTQLPMLVLEDGFTVSRFESPDNNLEAVFQYLVKE